MSSIPFYTPSLGALADYGMRALAQSLSQTSNYTPGTRAPQTSPNPGAEPKVADPQVADDLRSAVNGDTTHTLNNNYASFSTVLPSGTEYNADNLARSIAKSPPTEGLIVPLSEVEIDPQSPPIETRIVSLRAVEINLQKGKVREGQENGLSSSGIHPIWLENHGSLIGLNGAGVKLGGEQDDEVDNAGLIKGKTVALDMGGGNDKLMVRSGSRFEGLVDGGEGINGAYLDDHAGGTFNGSNRMNLWVAKGEWTLTGPIKNSEINQVYSGATLINQSNISGKMTVEPGATYSGGTVTNLNIAGTLRLEPATRIDNDLHMQAGSTLTFAPGSDKTLSVGNTANLSGATLNINVADENNVPSTPVHLINAQRIDGQFANVTSNLKNMTPVLTYQPDGVFVTFKRNA